MTLKTAVVGCGQIARATHLPNIVRCEQLVLETVCDIKPEAAEKAAQDFEAETWCTDWREVIGSGEIELVVLCTHTELRCELIVAAMEAGIPVYTEKPMASSEEELARILECARATKVPCCVGHNRRSGPAVLEFKRLFDKACEVGASQPASMDRTGGKHPRVDEERQAQLFLRVNDDSRSWKDWVFEDEMGIIFVEMVHFADLALWLMQSEPVEVTVSGSHIGNATTVIRFQDGSMTTLFHTMVGNFEYPKELYEGTVGNVTVVMDHHLEVRQCGMTDEPFRTCFPAKGGQTAENKQGIEAYYAALKRFSQSEENLSKPTVDKGHFNHLCRFAEHIEGKGENPCPVEEAVLSTRVAMRMREAVVSGGTVRL
ncbi:MAG: Gfo/Idh/MocA family protein [Candidatus Brocadiia bacterium]